MTDPTDTGLHSRLLAAVTARLDTARAAAADGSEPHGFRLLRIGGQP